VIAYLPSERLIVNADMYTPPKPGTPLPKPSASARTLLQTIQRNGLDVARHVGLHGGVGSQDDLIKIVGQPATN
jgi:hypothetical protein